jgi:hypothetical protein
MRLPVDTIVTHFVSAGLSEQPTVGRHDAVAGVLRHRPRRRGETERAHETTPASEASRAPRPTRNAPRP